MDNFIKGEQYYEVYFVFKHNGLYISEWTRCERCQTIADVGARINRAKSVGIWTGTVDGWAYTVPSEIRVRKFTSMWEDVDMSTLCFEPESAEKE